MGNVSLLYCRVLIPVKMRIEYQRNSYTERAMQRISVKTRDHNSIKREIIVEIDVKTKNNCTIIITCMVVLREKGARIKVDLSLTRDT